MGNEEDFESLRGLQSIGPNIFESNPTPSQEIKRLHITEKGKIVGMIVFTTKLTPINAASIQLCRLYTKIKINIEPK